MDFPKMHWPKAGTIYTETVVHTAPERYMADAPYKVAIVQADDGRRFTVRIAEGFSGQVGQIGDRVAFVEEKGGVAYYRLIDPQSNSLRRNSADSSNK